MTFDISEIIAWTEGIFLALGTIATLYYKIGRGKRRDEMSCVEPPRQIAIPIPSNGNGKISHTEFLARIEKCDRKFDRIHLRIDDQGLILGEIKNDVGYIRGRIDSK